MLYLFSDGFHDQFGEKGKNICLENFMFLLSISKENTEKQSKLIENDFEDGGAFEQIDDKGVMV